MTKRQIIEEPCEVKVSCTVLKTSGTGDSLAEFNGIRILAMDGGNPVPASGACVRPDSRKVKGQRAMKLEAHTALTSRCG